jgi:hypothetical protein
MRTNKEILAIADAHINARISKQWGNAPIVRNIDELVTELKNGHLYEGVLKEVEIRYVGVQSLLLQSVLDVTTETYKRNVRKGFKTLLQNRM